MRADGRVDGREIIMEHRFHLIQSGVLFFGVCDCGWYGPQQERPYSVAKDFHQHRRG